MIGYVHTDCARDLLTGYDFYLRTIFGLDDFWLRTTIGEGRRGTVERHREWSSRGSFVFFGRRFNTMCNFSESRVEHSQILQPGIWVSRYSGYRGMLLNNGKKNFFSFVRVLGILVVGEEFIIHSLSVLIEKALVCWKKFEILTKRCSEWSKITEKSHFWHLNLWNVHIFTWKNIVRLWRHVHGYTLARPVVMAMPLTERGRGPPSTRSIDRSAVTLPAETRWRLESICLYIYRYILLFFLF